MSTVAEPAAPSATTSEPGARRDRRSPSTGLKRIGTWVFVGVLAYLVFGPLVRLQLQAFGDGARGYSLAFGSSRIGEVVLTTVYLALGSLAIGMVMGTLLAWWAVRLPRGCGWMRLLPVLPIIVPAIASVVGWAFLLSPRPGFLNAALRRLPWWSGLSEGPIDVYSTFWIVVIVGIALSSFVYLFVSSGFANINGELIEAAYVSGSSPLATFFKVILPLLRPALIYGAGVALLLALGQFTAPLLLGSNGGVHVLTTEMYREIANFPIEYGVAAALGSPLLVFGILVVVGQRVLLGDQRRFITHGSKAFRGGWKPSWGAAAGVLGYFVLSTLLPLLALSAVALQPFWSGSFDVGTATFDNFRQVLATPGITGAIVNSLVVSALAVLIALPVGFVAATLLLRRGAGRVARAVLDFVIAAPLGIPAVLFGVGFLLTYTQAPLQLYGTRWILVLVYVTLMLPFATRMQLAALMSLGNAYEEASRTSGAGLLRTKARIVLPLLRPALAGAAALMFVLLTHEFTASVLVRAPFQQVMGTVLYDYWQNGSYPTVAAIALVMSGVTTVGVGTALAFGGSDSLSRM
ncbi:iron ABC transporter permease [Nitriliruptoraceae bacterium ZYF776]|nr:iron ABC transporter permease [Profundirhabdus halotolerans]